MTKQEHKAEAIKLGKVLRIHLGGKRYRINPTWQLQEINKHRKAAGLVSKHTMSHYSPKKRKTTKETISSLKKQIVKLQVKVARLNRTISGASSSSMMRSNY